MKAGGLPHGFYLFERQRLLFRLGLSLRFDWSLFTLVPTRGVS